MAKRNLDVGRSRYADPKPRLTTLKGERSAQRQRDELSGETKKREIAKVSLTKIDWSKKDV